MGHFPQWVELFSEAAESGIFEDQGAAIFKRDFYGPPSRTLVEAFGLCSGGVSFLVGC